MTKPPMQKGLEKKKEKKKKKQSSRVEERDDHLNFC
jgi:hypothetical protein